jgi:hypothetical protein
MIRPRSALYVVLAGLASLAPGSARPDEPLRVEVVRTARTERTDSLYLPNRPPLQATMFQKLPAGRITPRGWLRHQLELDAQGLVGRMPELSHYLNDKGNGWVERGGKDGWEEMPYWLRGYGDLGYVLKDEAIIATARKWIEGILGAQHDDGYFGPPRLRTAEGGDPDLWPHMLVLDALHSFYEFTGDERVPAFMRKYFRWQNTLRPSAFRKGWGAVRWADNLAEVYWLYNKTGEPWLLDLARKIHENSVNYTTDIPTWHNVNLAQGIREPAEFALLSKQAIHREATEKNYRYLMDNWGQFPGGGFAGDENIRKPFRDARQGFETCGFVEFLHTFEMMTRNTGQPVWSDRCEEIAFNSLPAALSPDHRGLHYITCANCIQLDDRSKTHAQFSNGPFPMLALKPGIDAYRCCPHNYGMGWPYYAEELWLATADHGLCASLYAASEVHARVADGTEVRIREETDYPFEETVRLRLEVPEAVRFPLYLRVPAWCEAPTLSINGKAVAAKPEPSSYLVVERTWNDGDTLTLGLPMRLAVRTWTRNKNAVSVSYGPLTFSLGMTEKWETLKTPDAWPGWNVLPGSPWNYGLVLDPNDPTQGLEVVRRPGPLADDPFLPATSPIQLRARARRIPNWQADADDVVTPLQPGPVKSSEPTETVTLIPMGAARLRITLFPAIGDGSDAHEWQSPQAGPKATASHVFGADTVDALGDGIEPASSGDQNIPRFTWWDHKGTTEWVQYDFPKPTTVAGVSLYWFDDTGRGQCRVPRSWRLLYRDGDTWKPVAISAEPGVARDRYNRVSFPHVETTALRVEAQLQEGFSGGILEWKVESKP